tara:strand:+ start:6100 stop:6234 length:135 start_codon:yes stop_codon:yes gene_type:complete
MIDTNTTQYLIEKEEFLSNKCPNCMNYLDDKGDCDLGCNGVVYY